MATVTARELYSHAKNSKERLVFRRALKTGIEVAKMTCWDILFPIRTAAHRMLDQRRWEVACSGKSVARKKAGQNPTCSPPGMRKRDCAFRTYLQIGYATAT